jgi:hypothetical protein
LYRPSGLTVYNNQDAMWMSRCARGADTTTFLATSRIRHAPYHTPRGTMATKLDKSIKRELEHQGKLYTITLAPEGVKVVEKGKRNGKELSWASIISGDASLNEDLKISVDATRSGM